MPGFPLSFGATSCWNANSNALFPAFFTSDSTYDLTWLSCCETGAEESTDFVSDYYYYCGNYLCNCYATYDSNCYSRGYANAVAIAAAEGVDEVRSCSYCYNSDLIS